MTNSTPLTYQQAGVDPDKAGKLIQNFASFLKTRPKDPNLLSGIGPFASCYSVRHWFENKKDPVLVTCCDGVGTKLKLALEWDELSGLGQDLVGMNVNDLLCAGAEPTLFLDYYATGKLNELQLTTLLKSIQLACEESFCSLAGGETAEMPGLYHGDDFDLAGFAVGVADRNQLLGPQRVKEGDFLIGLSSSGFHSNGYSLVRKIVAQEKISPNDRTGFSQQTWKEALLAPTKLYVKALKDQFEHIHACAHLTGGGLFENLPRVLPPNLTASVSKESWQIPPLFRWFQQKAALDETQLLSTFNCGIGMVVIVAPEQLQPVLSLFKSRAYDAKPVGKIVAFKGSPILWE